MANADVKPDSNATLKRDVGLGGAVLLGLGSILGTGAFVTIGLGAELAGGYVLWAIAAAAAVAFCNALSSAQLAAAHPVAGGTYEYGYRYIHPTVGFSAGWLFLTAKSASAATAALGLTAYALTAFGGDVAHTKPIAASICILMTVIVLLGLRRSNWLNLVLVSVGIGTLALFVIIGLMSTQDDPFTATPQQSFKALSFLEAVGLMFVAYTGYGRIATLGEEVHDPKRSIPIAVVITLIASMVIYLAVAAVALMTVGANAFAQITNEQGAPLEALARQWGYSWVANAMLIGAIAAMGGVLLNLLLGLSRVLLAMGRRRDMPAAVAKIDKTGTTPYVSVTIIGLVITGLVLWGDIKSTWSLSAFTVLIYYGLTNLAALRLEARDRLYPRVLAYLGIAACIGLSVFIDAQSQLIGLSILAVGLVWHVIAVRIRNT